MSYDLVFRRESPREDQDVIWPRPPRRETVDGIEQLTPVEVREAFRDAFGERLQVCDDRLVGPGFEVLIPHAAQSITVRCARSLSKSEEGRAVHMMLALVAFNLDATIVDTRAPTPTDPTIQPVAADLAQLGEPRRVEHAWPDDDRAQSFARLETWQIAGPDDGRNSLYSLFLREAADELARYEFSHPIRMTDLACTCVRLVQSIVPFEILIARGRGSAPDGTGCSFPNRVLAIIDGKVGFLASPRPTIGFDQEAKVVASTWTNVEWSPTGPAASARGPTIDLTGLFERAARAALAQAHQGRTRVLRDWLVLMASLDRQGIAAEELFVSEAPTLSDGPRAFELFDAGAVMPIWLATPAVVEARLRLPDSGGFVLKVITLDRSAPARHAFDPPLGPP